MRLAAVFFSTNRKISYASVKLHDEKPRFTYHRQTACRKDGQNARIYLNFSDASMGVGFTDSVDKATRKKIAILG